MTNRVQHAEKRIHTGAERLNLPGCAAALIHGGQLASLTEYGYADLESHQPITPQTIFRVGSISKTLTAVGVMRLVEAGQVDLDAPANAYLRAFQLTAARPDINPNAVTVRHLLTHTGGLGTVRHWRALLSRDHASDPRRQSTPPPLRQFYAGGLPVQVQPGRKWCYANDGFAALGQLIEDVSGAPFAEAMRQLVFEPLGMADTGFRRTDAVQQRLATGYKRSGDRHQPVRFLDVVTEGAGAAYSTLDDMLRFTAALLNSGANEHGRVLQPATLAQMFAPHYQLDARLSGQGLAFILESWGGRRIVWHNGAWDGFSASLWLAPADQSAALLLTNTLAPALDRLAEGALRHLLDEPAPEPAESPGDPGVWPSLTGYYAPESGFLTNVKTWLTYGGGLNIRQKRGQPVLAAQIDPASTAALQPVPGDALAYRFTRKDKTSLLVFQRDAAGQVDRLCFDLYVFYRRPRWHSLGGRLELATLAILALLLGIGALLWLL